MNGTDAVDPAGLPMVGLSESSRSREHEAVQALVRRHEGHVNALVRRLLGADREHEDIVQDVFVRLISSWRTVREADRERQWVSSVTVNQVRNHLRRRKVRRIVELSPAAGVDVAAGQLDPVTRDLVQRGYRLLDHLAANDRIALLLRRGEARTVEDVARLCRCSPATIKRRVRRAEHQVSLLLAGDPQLATELREMGWLA